MLFVNEKYNSINSILSNTNEAKEVVSEADNSWGEIFESIICEAYNNKGKVPEKSQYAATVESRGMSPQTLYKNIYDSLKKYKMPHIRKLENANPVTDEWYRLGLYKESGSTPNNTPKTDILGGKFHISVKEGSGARLMSGAVNESIATIRAAIESLNDADLNKEVNDLFNKLKSVGTRARLSSADLTVGAIKKKYKGISYSNDDLDEDERKVLTIEELKIEFNEFVAKVNSNKDIREAIIREALTGTVKFGKDSTSCANYILTWENDGTCHLYTIDEFYNEFGSHYRVKSAFKSSAVTRKGVRVGRDIWMVLSIT